MTDYTVALGTQYTLRLRVTQSSQNKTANTSLVAWSLVAIKNTGTGYWSFDDTGWGVNINGVATTGILPDYTFVGKSSITLGSGTQTISHASDGTKAIGITGYWAANNAPALALGEITGKTFTLTPIPRATAPSVTPSPSTEGSTVTISLPRASAAFTHDLTWVAGTLSGVIGTGIATGTTWTVPAVLAEYPTRSQAPVVITAETKNGAAVVGSASTTLMVRSPPTYTDPGDQQFPFALRARLVKFAGGVWSSYRTIPTTDIQLVDPHSATATCSITVSRLLIPDIEDYSVIDIQVQDGVQWVDTGLRFALNRVEDDDTDLAESVKYSGTNFVDYLMGFAYTQKAWKWKGVSPGTILNNLIADARSRGWGPLNYVDFSPTKTSVETPWIHKSIDREVGKGTPLIQVLEGLVTDGLVEYRTLYADNRAYLQLNNPGTGSDWAVSGADPIVDLSAAPLSSAPRRGSSESVLTRVTVAGDGDLQRTRERVADDAAVFGQLEGWLAATGVTSKGEADRIGDNALTDASKPTDERTFVFSANATDRHLWPYAAIHPGDWVRVPGVADANSERARVSQITMSTDADGVVTVTILTGDRILSGTGALAKRQKASSGGAIPGGSLRAPVTLDASIPSAPANVTAISDGYWDSDGAAKSAVTVAWSLVTTSAAGTELDVDYYEVWWRPDVATPWAMQTISGDADVTMVGWDVNKSTQFRVRGRSVAGIFGEWSLFVEHTTSEPNELLLAPSTPIVTDNALGSISIEWNGLIGGSPAPKQLAYTRAEISQAELGPFSPAGAPLLSAGIATIDPGMYGTWYLRLVPVDRLGLVGTPSVVVATTTIDPGLVLKTPKAPIGLAFTTDSAFTTDGTRVEAWFDLTWTAVTQDIDSAPIGISGYEVWGMIAGGTSMNLMTTVEGAFARTYVNPGDSWDIEVRAISDVGKRGGFSAPISALANGSVPVLGTPSTPAVSSTRGLIRVDWDGLIDGVQPPTSFRYVKVEYAPTETMVYELAGQTFTRGGGAMFIPATVGIDHTVRLTPVAGDGISGGPSLTASVVVVGINVLDFTPLIETMLTEPRIETSPNDNEGVKLYNGGIVAYNAAGEPTILINAEDGTIYFAQGVIDGDAVITGSILADKIDVTSLVATLVSSPLGNSLNLASNDSVNILVGGAVATVQSGVDAVTNDLGEMQTYYQFGPDGAIITSPSSVFSVQISNEQIDMMASGTSVSHWNASGLVAASLIARQTATIGAHQHKKEGVRTTIRAL